MVIVLGEGGALGLSAWTLWSSKVATTGRARVAIAGNERGIALVTEDPKAQLTTGQIKIIHEQLTTRA
jgi:hypothetical protein